MPVEAHGGEEEGERGKTSRGKGIERLGEKRQTPECGLAFSCEEGATRRLLPCTLCASYTDENDAGQQTLDPWDYKMSLKARQHLVDAHFFALKSVDGVNVNVRCAI